MVSVFSLFWYESGAISLCGSCGGPFCGQQIEGQSPWGLRQVAAPALGASNARRPSSERAGSGSGDHNPKAGCRWGMAWHVLALGGYRCALLCQRRASGVPGDGPCRAGPRLPCAAVLHGRSLLPFLQPPQLYAKDCCLS